MSVILLASYVRQLHGLFQGEKGPLCHVCPSLDDIFRHAAGEQHGLLAHETDLRSQPANIQLANVISVQENGSALWVVEPQQQAHNSRLKEKLFISTNIRFIGELPFRCPTGPPKRWFLRAQSPGRSPYRPAFRD